MENIILLSLKSRNLGKGVIKTEKQTPGRKRSI